MLAPLILLGYAIWGLSTSNFSFWESFVVGAALGSSAYAAWKLYFS